MSSDSPEHLPAAPADASLATVNDGDNARASWSIPGDQVKANLSHFTPEVRELLLWLYFWAIGPKTNKSMGEVADLLKCDKSTLFRVFKGTYKNERTGKLIVPDKLVRAVAALRKIEGERSGPMRDPFVATPTAKRIATVAELCLSRGRVGMIWGKSQTGKTTALQEYQRQHSHAVKYICIEPSSGTHELVRLLAIACGVSPKGAHDEMKRRILRALDHNNLLIIDEVHQFAFTYRTRSKLSCLELLRWVHDQTGCGLLLCGTNVWRDELVSGRDKALLEQLARRGAVKLQLPDAPTDKDLDALYEAHGLPEPDAEEARTMRELAKRHGLTVVTETIAFGRRQAAKSGSALTWDDVMRARAILDGLEHPAGE